MREEGFYWVKDDEQWIIAEWDGGIWYTHGNDYEFQDSDFQEIDERKIQRG